MERGREIDGGDGEEERGREIEKEGGRGEKEREREGDLSSHTARLAWWVRTIERGSDTISRGMCHRK